MTDPTNKPPPSFTRTDLGELTDGKPGPLDGKPVPPHLCQPVVFVGTPVAIPLRPELPKPEPVLDLHIMFLRLLRQLLFPGRCEPCRDGRHAEHEPYMMHAGGREHPCRCWRHAG